MSKKLVYTGISRNDTCWNCGNTTAQYLMTIGSWRCGDCGDILAVAEISIDSTVTPDPWFAVLNHAEYVACYKAMSRAFIASIKARDAVGSRNGDDSDFADLASEIFETWQDMFSA